MKHAAYITFITGSIARVEVEAQDAATASAQVFAKFPPGCIDSVSARPIRGAAAVTLDALSLRVSKTPLFDSSFGCLV